MNRVGLSGAVYDVRGQNAVVSGDWKISHTIRIVYLDRLDLRLVVYKRADMPLRWRKRNPLRVITLKEVEWLIEAGYWKLVKYRRLGYLEQAEIREEILWRARLR